MNCCDAFGQCTQGRTCPLRTGHVLPDQAAFAAKVARSHPRTCEQLGVCQGRGDCTCTQPTAATDLARSPVPPEAGTFQITYLGKDEGEWTGVTLGDLWRWLRPTLPTLAGVLLCVGVAGMGVGYLTERHADVLWTLLQGVS